MVNKSFKNMLWQNMEAYLDDMLVKSIKGKIHVSNLQKNLRMHAHSQCPFQHLQMRIQGENMKIIGIHGKWTWNRDQSRKLKAI